jgi:hypothetical protein
VLRRDVGARDWRGWEDIVVVSTVVVLGLGWCVRKYATEIKVELLWCKHGDCGEKQQRKERAG